MKLAVMLALCSVPVHAHAGEKNLCRADEKAWFSCETRSGKLVSLCGSPELSAKQSYVQYRFGRSGAIELEWPGRRSLRRERLRLEHSRRGPCDGIFFINGKHRYDLAICLKNEVARSKATGRKTRGFAGVLVGRCKTRRCRHWETTPIAEISCKKHPGFGFDASLRGALRSRLDPANTDADHQLGGKRVPDRRRQTRERGGLPWL